MEYLNLPNLLSVIRLLISPLAGYILFKDHLWLATLLYLLLALSDFLDGLIARKMKKQTPLGTVLDPIADKVLIFSYILALWWGDFRFKPDTLLVVLWLLKEFTVIVGSLLLLIKGNLPRPNFAGKVATFLLFVYGIVLLLCNLGVETAIYIKPYIEGFTKGTLLLALVLYLRDGIGALLKIS
jgi:cardiolipin synthase